MRCLIQFDATGWAQNLHAEGLRKFAPKGIDVMTQLLSAPVPRDAECVYTINAASCRKMSGKRVATCIASHAWLYPTNDPNNWRTRGVNPRRNSEVGKFHLTQADAIVCRNTALATWSSQFTEKAKYIPAGIDPELWHPAGRKVNNGKLRVGWSGQVNPEMSGRFKGFDEVWTPLKERLCDRYEFVENIRTAAEALSWEEMRRWYSEIDVFICCATAEGTPNGPLCAAACGAVVLSTNVGQCADWSVLRDRHLIVPDYGNQEEADDVVAHLVAQLSRHEDSATRQLSSEMLMASIEREYSYRVLSPKTLSFVTGVEL